jgi:hypothetical protein
MLPNHGKGDGQSLASSLQCCNCMYGQCTKTRKAYEPECPCRQPPLAVRSITPTVGVRRGQQLLVCEGSTDKYCFLGYPTFQGKLSLGTLCTHNPKAQSVQPLRNSERHYGKRVEVL